MKMWILYDGRACGDEGTEDASVLVSCDSAAEAEEYKGDYGSMACYSYDCVDGKLVNEQWEWDWHPGT